MYTKLQRDCTATLLLRKINYFLNKHPNVFTFLYLSYVKIIDCPWGPELRNPRTTGLIQRHCPYFLEKGNAEKVIPVPLLSLENFFKLGCCKNCFRLGVHPGCGCGAYYKLPGPRSHLGTGFSSQRSESISSSLPPPLDKAYQPSHP